jgi:hypothetical protein
LACFLRYFGYDKSAETETSPCFWPRSEIMKRTLILGVAVVTLLGMVSASQAQVFIRAPFVRVAVGDGVAVRAPFVNLYIPPSGPVYYAPFGPRVIYMPPPPVVVQSQAPASEAVPAPKTPIVDTAPPAPAQPAQVTTLDSFAKSFQPKAGSYEVTLLNPVTKQPTAVRFLLPEGTPRRVHVTRDSIEFVYRIGQWVRIEFDREGAIVTSR